MKISKFVGGGNGKYSNLSTPTQWIKLCYKFFCDVLLAVLDADYRFISVDVGRYGKNLVDGILNTYFQISVKSTNTSWKTADWK
jgi:hypothetical protein